MCPCACRELSPPEVKGGKEECVSLCVSVKGGKEECVSLCVLPVRAACGWELVDHYKSFATAGSGKY